MTNKDFIKKIKDIFNPLGYKVNKNHLSVDISKNGLSFSFYNYDKIYDENDISFWYLSLYINGNEKNISIGKENLDTYLLIIKNNILPRLEELHNSFNDLNSTLIKIANKDKSLFRDIKIENILISNA